MIIVGYYQLINVQINTNIVQALQQSRMQRSEEFIDSLNQGVRKKASPGPEGNASGLKPENLSSEVIKAPQPQSIAPTERITYKSKAQMTLITLNIALSFFYFGYILVYFSQLNFQTKMETLSFNISTSAGKGILNGCVPLGALVGALSSRFFINSLSRRKFLLIVNCFALIVGGLIYIENFYTLVIFRFCQGLCVGAYSVIAPLIITEIAPVEISGTLGSYSQLLLSFGVFIAYIFTYILKQITDDLKGSVYWYYSFGFPQITILIQTAVLIFVFPYETPKYLLSVGKEEEARKLIEAIYKPQYVQQIFDGKLQQATLTEKKQSVQTNQMVPQGEISKQPKKAQTVIPTVVAIHVEVFQQFSGVLAIALYAGSIAGQITTGQLSLLMPSIVTFSQVLGAFFAGFLLMRFGRKYLLQIGTITEAVAHTLVVAGYYIRRYSEDPNTGQILILVGLFLFMFIYGLLLGPVIWLYVPEVVQPKTLPFASAANWICATIIVVLFPVLTESVLDGNPGPLFIFFAVWCVASFIFNIKFIIETKGKSHKAIHAEYEAMTC